MDAFAYCTDLKKRARLAGAVNAMKFEVDRVTGEHFDGIGLTNDITRNLGRSMKSQSWWLMARDYPQSIWMLNCVMTPRHISRSSLTKRA
ncbi:hypothetical protein [Bradyrhizobium sp. LHD-71]|uniref:hypothetical protein n=1 Tax=Bradyrhizobium sp. LHD-71 TaxID=3072141 RepID=UPI00280CAB7F|nr:hypothetical protein [Bradyrhizobium sp. LHD-71]MDQ8727517.1 hypothetical protein [Bradyrhizobium sp. LHD-71]